MEEPAPAPALSIPEDLFLDCPEWGELDLLEVGPPSLAEEVPLSTAQPPTGTSASCHALGGEPGRRGRPEEAVPHSLEVVAVILPWDPSHSSFYVTMQKCKITHSALGEIMPK